MKKGPQRKEPSSMFSTLAFTNFWHGGGQGLTEQVAKVAFSAGYQAGHAKAWDEAMEAYDRATKGAKEGEACREKKP